MIRLAKIQNGVIVALWEGEGLYATTEPGVVVLPDGDWEVGDSPAMDCGEVLMGQGVPPNKLGKNSCVYVDVDSGNVYRKQNNTWF